MNEKPRELLFTITRKDFKIEAIRGSGHGGQHKNVTNSKCRMTHIASGAVGQSQDERSYHQNERTAFLRLIETPKFKMWHKMEVSRRVGILKDLVKTVAEQMKHIQVQVKDAQGRWIDEPQGGTNE